MSRTLFTKDHEWIKIDGGIATVGITDYAQKQLGDIVYVELPDIGHILTQGSQGAVVESVKAASEVYCPIAGTVSAVNDALVDQPALVNEQPEDAGWFFQIEIEDGQTETDLMDAEAYGLYRDALE